MTERLERRRLKATGRRTNFFVLFVSLILKTEECSNIRKVKMQHACRLLDDPEKTVGEVALALGYFNRKYFTACFKEEFGQTPSEYQKHHCRGDALKQEGGTNE